VLGERVSVFSAVYIRTYVVSDQSTDTIANRIPTKRTNTRTTTNSRKNKEVASLQRQLAAMKMSKSGASRTAVRKQRTQNNARTGVVTAMDVPFQRTFAIQQNQRDEVYAMEKLDKLVSWSVSALTPIGALNEITLNPLSIGSTRLQQMARLYSKYRFKSVELVIGQNLPTTTGGTYVAGFYENPDQDILFGQSALQSIMTQKGAVAAAFWNPISIKAKISDRNKWYNLDLDSAEVMQTTQGKFVMAIENAPTITGITNVPLYLRYSIEFAGATIQVNPFVSGPVIFPAANWVPFTAFAYNGTILSGEIPFPTLIANKPYIFNPPLLLGQNGSPVSATVYQFAASVSSFYPDIEAFESSLPLSNLGNFETLRTTVTQYSPN